MPPETTELTMPGFMLVTQTNTGSERDHHRFIRVDQVEGIYDWPPKSYRVVALKDSNVCCIDSLETLVKRFNAAHAAASAPQRP